MLKKMFSCLLKINFYFFFVLEPPLLGPGGAYPPYGPPDFHQSDGWKNPPGHPGLIKDPPIAPGRNGPTNFVGQAQQQVVSSTILPLKFNLKKNTKKKF